MTDRKHIRLLPVVVANKIAAGEVVERPASVVKELIENAMDAGATRVEVTITAGGRKLVSISDNGIGMGRDDALMCLEPQATSKIRDVDDIERIDTYGFRGEAIPSIAAVSRFTLRTCAKGETVGTAVEVVGGLVQDVSEIGFPPGTTFEIRDLFFNVPARRKFLKSFNTEQGHIRTAFLVQALAHPETGMRLKADGRDLYNLAAGASLEERVGELFGAEFLASLRPVDFTKGHVRIHGYAGVPALNRADRGEQYVFVNRRASTAPVVGYALREAYPPLDGNRKPVVILFIDLPPTEVDVNVHPTKREVRFRDAPTVRDAIIEGVTQALGIVSAHADMAPEGLPPSAALPPGPSAPVPPMPVWRPREGKPFGEGAYSGLLPPKTAPETIPAPPPATGTPVEDPRREPPAPPPAAIPPPCVQPRLEPDAERPRENAPWAWCRILGQIADGYVILETDGGYVVLDPQAAHERVLYERMREASARESPASQPLLIPASVRLPPDDAARLRENLEIMRSMGFGIDLFGEDGHFIIDALPVGIEAADLRSFLLDISTGIAAAGTKRGVGKWRENAVAQAATKAAVSRTGPLPPEALSALVRDLAETDMPYVCPRGRPTMLFTPLRELARKFGRE